MVNRKRKKRQSVRYPSSGNGINVYRLNEKIWYKHIVQTVGTVFYSIFWGLLSILGADLVGQKDGQ